MKSIWLLFALLATNPQQGDNQKETLSPEQERFKAAMQTFSERRYDLAQKISKELNLPIPLRAHRFFQAAISGDEKEVAERMDAFGETKGYPQDPELYNELWVTIHETVDVYDGIWKGWEKDVGLLRLFYEPILSVMPPGSIYFGGTDPGRFLITLMNEVEGSKVFCLTQNALAESVYTSHIRFVYGKQIWLPSAEDSIRAFQQFIDEVQAGRHPNADVTIVDGRVQVQGVLAVMAINGIMVQDIFDKNKDKHAFYVEESYVLEWMYPYLEPCGLIMKLTPSAKITEEVIAKDMAFWTKHIELLEQQPGFANNRVARHSFAKLRCGIAGLYEHHEMYEQAETAFQQALRIDPASPEATARLAGMREQQKKNQ